MYDSTTLQLTARLRDAVPALIAARESGDGGAILQGRRYAIAAAFAPMPAPAIPVTR